MTAYRFFFHDRRGEVQNEYMQLTGQPMSFADLSEHMMNMWENNLDTSTKAHYEELQAKDERRYMLECIAWEALIEREKEEEEKNSTATTAKAI